MNKKEQARTQQFVKLNEGSVLQSHSIQTLRKTCADVSEQKNLVRSEDYPKIKTLTESIWNALESVGKHLWEANSHLVATSYTGLGSLLYLLEQVIVKCSNANGEIWKKVSVKRSPWKRLVEARNSCHHGDSTPLIGSLDTALEVANWLLEVSLEKGSITQSYPQQQQQQQQLHPSNSYTIPQSYTSQLPATSNFSAPQSISTQPQVNNLSSVSQSQSGYVPNYSAHTINPVPVPQAYPPQQHSNSILGSSTYSNPQPPDNRFPNGYQAYSSQQSSSTFPTTTQSLSSSSSNNMFNSQPYPQQPQASNPFAISQSYPSQQPVTNNPFAIPQSYSSQQSVTSNYPMQNNY
jgi:hypothetical protein